MRGTVTDTIVYVGSHYEKHVPKHDLDGNCVITVVDIMLVVAQALSALCRST